MDYTYFSAAPEQSYAGLGSLHPLHPHDDCKPDGDQFSSQTPTGIFGSNFVPYDTSFHFTTPHTAGNPQQQQVTAPPPLPLPTTHPTTQQQQPAEQYQNHYVFEPSPSEGSSGARTGDGSAGYPTSVIAEDGPVPEERQLQGRSSSEEKEMANLTPAQSRRKAQNRAAQRAFRERKERRVRDLEEELGQYKQNFSSLLEDNESLKRQLAKIATENEILRATQAGGANGMGDNAAVKEEITVGPLKYSPTDYTKLNHNSTNTNGNGSINGNNANVNNNGYSNGGDTEKKASSLISHRIKVSEKTGEKLLDAAAAWDLIVNHRADQNSELDVQNIYERLKGQTQCDGQQPVIEEGRVRQAILDSISAANDNELL